MSAWVLRFAASSVLAVSGCLQPEHPAVNPSPSAPHSPTKLDVPKTDEPMRSGCDCTHQHNQAMLERARAIAESKVKELMPPSEAAAQRWDLPLDLPCWETPNGAWAVIAMRAVVCPRGVGTAEWMALTENRIAHVDAVTCAIAQSPIEWPIYQPFETDARFSIPDLPCTPEYRQLDPIEPALYDFNADGEPELWLTLRDKYSDGTNPTNHLLTVQDNQVKSYLPPGLQYQEFEDKDADQRPDLIWSFELGSADDCSDHGYEVDGPQFLAHSRTDGTFSYDDALSRDFVRHWCSEPPQVIDSTEAVACARLYGRTSVSLLQMLESVPPTDCQAADGHELSDIVGAMRTMASVPLPFTLRPSPR